MKVVSLNGKWNLTGKPQISEEIPISLEATVPGCVQLDLSEQGYLPKDIYMGENVVAAEKYESYEWWYERRFQAPGERKNVFLVFEGVDCLAEYFLNGTKIGESDNMFIRHEFKVDDFLKDGENTLTVHIKSAVIESDNFDYTIKMLNNPVNIESRHIRKAPHGYGWDIMPRLVTAGLWRDVKIEIRDSIYFSQTFFKAKDADCSFYYVLESDRNDFKDVEVELTASCGDDSCFSERIACRKKAGVMNFYIIKIKIKICFEVYSMLKEKIRNREKIIGTHINFCDPSVGRIAGLAGYDFIWIDMEHNYISFESLLSLIIAVKSTGTDVIVRAPQDDLTATKKIIEMGPDGIIFPMVRCAKEADRLLSYTLYPPYGRRGFGPMNAVGYGAFDTMEYISTNHDTMCRFIQIEHIDAVKNLDEIMKNQYIDGYIIGANDLSGSINELCNVFGENTTSLIKTVITKLKTNSKYVGLSTGDLSESTFKHWCDMGIDMISAGADFDFLTAGMKKNKETLSKIMKGL